MFRSTVPMLALLVAAACSGSDASATPEGPLTIEQTTFAADLGIDLGASTKSATGLYTRDLVVGDGAVVANGQELDVYYDGRLANGSRFDATVPGNPFTFTVGGRVIDGWNQGVIGMRVGGKRQLVIPPALGYGANGIGPIPPNAVLVFTVEVLAAR
jgi:peptidylprolyl isomerase